MPKKCCAQPLRRGSLLQITIVGPQYGQWGVQKFGTKPARVDALSFYQERLQALLQEVEQAQARCLPPNEKVMPAAFVTFTQRHCEVRRLDFSPLCQLTSHLLSTSELQICDFLFCGHFCLSLPQQG